MKKRFLAGLAVLAMLAAGVGCGGHSPCWDGYALSEYEEAPGYYWAEGVADMGSRAGELTLYYLTLAEKGEAEIVCSLARDQMRGEAAVYWEDPEGTLTLVRDMAGRGVDGSCTLPEGTSRLLVRADAGKYEVGVGLSGLAEGSVLYMDALPPAEGGTSLPRPAELSR